MKTNQVNLLYTPRPAPCTGADASPPCSVTDGCPLLPAVEAPSKGSTSEALPCARKGGVNPRRSSSTSAQLRSLAPHSCCLASTADLTLGTLTASPMALKPLSWSYMGHRNGAYDCALWHVGPCAMSNAPRHSSARCTAGVGWAAGVCVRAHRSEPSVLAHHTIQRGVGATVATRLAACTSMSPKGRKTGGCAIGV
jgi:hypothetical protein